MPHVTIRLQVDPVTRKKNVIISYESDSGALPLEHEDEHRRLVDKLIEGGALKAQELGKIVVERPQDEAQGQSSPQAEPQREGLTSKS
ncbi:MAG: hypothetical protein QM765_20750 [Myxococcales bacterium]